MADPPGRHQLPTITSVTTYVWSKLSHEQTRSHIFGSIPSCITISSSGDITEDYGSPNIDIDKENVFKGWYGCQVTTEIHVDDKYRVQGTSKDLKAVMPRLSIGGLWYLPESDEENTPTFDNSNTDRIDMKVTKAFIRRMTRLRKTFKHKMSKIPKVLIPTSVDRQKNVQAPPKPAGPDESRNLRLSHTGVMATANDLLSTALPVASAFIDTNVAKGVVGGVSEVIKVTNRISVAKENRENLVDRVESLCDITSEIYPMNPGPMVKHAVAQLEQLRVDITQDKGEASTSRSGQFLRLNRNEAQNTRNDLRLGSTVTHLSLTLLVQNWQKMKEIKRILSQNKSLSSRVGRRVGLKHKYDVLAHSRRRGLRRRHRSLSHRSHNTLFISITIGLAFF
ncbi:hypothetical protein M422DRAFT_37323 [Sphaerobolus stellatus SS14]|uniref:Uncharacterized protein n=1 Tax=Sphaerobolus stellatus (strain SS14) TaxID=990650 RepID=A0A0C9U2V2_SPHS4|nr:hypothetical protein M422DRAFT_37323 [Sphaerobolus stellatus SS14]